MVEWLTLLGVQFVLSYWLFDSPFFCPAMLVQHFHSLCYTTNTFQHEQNYCATYMLSVHTDGFLCFISQGLLHTNLRKTTRNTCTVCDNITSWFRFHFVYMERSNRLNGRSISSVCITVFWQNGEEMIAQKTNDQHSRLGALYKKLALGREAVPIASWFASKIKWSVSSGHRNILAKE